MEFGSWQPTNSDLAEQAYLAKKIVVVKMANHPQPFAQLPVRREAA